MAAALLAVALLAAACGTDTDQEMPVITAEGVPAQPSECDAYAAGDTIHFCYRFTDNVELGRYNIEVHGNHDHHTHSSAASDCPPDDDDEHEAVDPWVFNQDYDIPAGTRDYTARQDIVVPHGKDPGDYHFMVRLTDRAGWQQLHSIAIKLVAE